MKVIKRSGRRAFSLCANGCVRSHDGESKNATHTVWIIGIPTELCKRCSEEWKATWEGAIGPAEQELSHATPEMEMAA